LVPPASSLSDRRFIDAKAKEAAKYTLFGPYKACAATHHIESAMIGTVGSFAVEHIIALGAGGAALVAGIVLRNYGRRLERQTLARARRLDP